MKEQFRKNIFSILEEKNVDGILLNNTNTLKFIIDDHDLFDIMYEQFENNFAYEFEENDLFMKTEDYMYRLNLLVNDCIIKNFNFHENNDIKNIVQDLIKADIDLYSAVSYDVKEDKIILEEFCEIYNERKLGI